MAGLPKTIETSSQWRYTGRHGAYFHLVCVECGFKLKVSRRLKEMRDPCPVSLKGGP